MGVIDHQARAVALRQGRQRASGATSPSMLNTPSVRISAARRSAARSSSLGARGIGVRITAQPRAREARAVEQRGMAEAVGKHESPVAREER